MVIAGIDYSLCGPAICVFDGDTFSYKNCSFYYLTDVKKYADAFGGNVFGERFLDWNTEQERYKTIADWAIEIVMGCSHVAVEGYAYSATGRIFHIAENTGLLKYKLYEMGLPTTIIPPTEVKKYATGKGNADKQMMYDSFVQDTGAALRLTITPDKKEITSPVSDIVDSYFICKKLFDSLTYPLGQ
jgi:hypothetical protein